MKVQREHLEAGRAREDSAAAAAGGRMTGHCVCTVCRETLPLEAYQLDARRQRKYAACRACRNAKRRVGEAERKAAIGPVPRSPFRVDHRERATNVGEGAAAAHAAWVQAGRLGAFAGLVHCQVCGLPAGTEGVPLVRVDRLLVGRPELVPVSERWSARPAGVYRCWVCREQDERRTG